MVSTAVDNLVRAVWPLGHLGLCRTVGSEYGSLANVVVRCDAAVRCPQSGGRQSDPGS
jgi:hypothetical protein